jgi:hypothetical protein
MRRRGRSFQDAWLDRFRVRIRVRVPIRARVKVRVGVRVRIRVRIRARGRGVRVGVRVRVTQEDWGGSTTALCPLVSDCRLMFISDCSPCLCNPFFTRSFLLVLPSFPRPPQELKDVAVGQQRKVLEYFAPRSVASVVSTRGRGAQRAGEGDDGGKNDRAGAWLLPPLGPMDFIAESGIIHTFPAFFPPPLPPSLPPSLSPYYGPGADRRPSTLPPPLPPSFPHGGWCPPPRPASQPLGVP